MSGRSPSRAALAAAIAALKGSLPAAGTPAGRFLADAGATPPYPEAVRFSPSVPFERGAVNLPALLAPVRGPQGVVAAAITFLRDDGRLAPVTTPRLVLGDLGDGAIRLAPPAPMIAFAATIEGALLASARTGLPAWAIVYLARARAVVVPPCVQTVRIFAGDQMVDELRGASLMREQEPQLL